MLLLTVLAAAALCPLQAEEIYDPETTVGEDGFVTPALPRWREGGTPYNPEQSRVPYAVGLKPDKDWPETGLIESPPEYEPSQGVLFAYHSSGWPTVVRDLVASLTGDPSYDEIAYVVVTSPSQMSSATSAFVGAGADMNKVEFIMEPMDAIWIRDYGPHFIWQDSAVGVVNSQYYPTRSLDNFVPELVGNDYFKMPTYDMGLYYSGGNFQPGPNRNGYVTSIIDLDNPASEGFSADFIAELYQKYQGIDTLHVFPQLPFSVDGTGHIDMWMYLVDSENVIISEFKPGSNADAIEITNNAAVYMEHEGFNVHRTPAWNANHPTYGYSTHWTYTNALRVNDRIFIPSYGSYSPYLDEDAEALTVFETAAGHDVEIVPIDCYPIIWASGAIHCITMQVPRRIESTPAAHVIYPNGGELLEGGTTATISWVATDENNAEIPTVELYYSLDGGLGYEFIDSTSNTGVYDWPVPDGVWSDRARVKVVAISADSDQGEAVSEGMFDIAPCDQTVYDFSSGVGSDKVCFGSQTASWSSIEGNRRPVSTEISSSNYAKISQSDATGTDSDPNRYVAPDPNNGYESTHMFEFTIAEDTAAIDEITILWEGYSDNCAMMEMYVWDYVEENWCDAEGAYSQNRFVDNWAGNRDGLLVKHLRGDWDRYLSPGGQLSLLLYSERGPDGYYISYNPTFHDYISVTVSSMLPQWTCGDVDSNNLINISDAVFLIDYIFGGGPAPEFEEAADVDCDEIVNISDAVYLIAYIFSGGPPPCAGC
jgi:agmatine deiminase